MRRNFRVQLAKTVFNTITKFGVVSPQQLTNACLLLGLPLTIDRKNRLLMYFMMKDQFETYERNIEPTDLEGQQIAHIASHFGEDLSEYISHLEDGLAPTVTPGHCSIYAGHKEECPLDVDKTETALAKNGESHTLSVTNNNQSHSECPPIEFSNSNASNDEAREAAEKITAWRKELETATDANQKRSLKQKINKLNKKMDWEQ
jgi:hypothetical protein